METMLEQQGTEEEKRNQKKEAGYPNISTPWKTGPNPNLALESTLYLKVCVFIKQTASRIFLTHFFLNEEMGCCRRGAPWAHPFMWQKQAKSDISGVAVNVFFFLQAPPTTFTAQAAPFSTHLFTCGSCSVQQDTPITPTDLLNGGVKAASNMLHWEGKKNQCQKLLHAACWEKRRIVGVTPSAWKLWVETWTRTH